MKKPQMRMIRANYFSRFLKSTAVILFLSGFVQANAHAIPVPPKIATAPDPVAMLKSAQVRQLGLSNGNMVFEIKFNNVTGQKFKIMLKDIDGTLLYTDSFHQQNFEKRFVVPFTESNRLIVVLKTSVGTKTETFEINEDTHMVQNTLVNTVF